MIQVVKIKYFIFCLFLLPFNSYSQVTIDVKKAKPAKWSEVQKDKKDDQRYRNMTKAFKNVYIDTYDYSDSFKTFIGDKRRTNMKEIVGAYNDFEYLKTHQQTPSMNYVATIPYEDAKDKYVYIYLYNDNKIKLFRFKIYENYHFIYILNYYDEWILRYSNIFIYN